jgi:hypothetical protein
VSGVCPCSVCPFSHCVVVPVPCALSVIVWWSPFRVPFQSLCGGPCSICPSSHCVVVPVPYALSVIVWWSLYRMPFQSLCGGPCSICPASHCAFLLWFTQAKRLPAMVRNLVFFELKVCNSPSAVFKLHSLLS